MWRSSWNSAPVAGVRCEGMGTAKEVVGEPFVLAKAAAERRVLRLSAVGGRRVARGRTRRSISPWLVLPGAGGDVVIM